jgi:hypothetical protein
MVPEPNPDCQPEQFSMEIFTEIYQRKPKKISSKWKFPVGKWKCPAGKWKVPLVSRNFYS